MIELMKYICELLEACLGIDWFLQYGDIISCLVSKR